MRSKEGVYRDYLRSVCSRVAQGVVRDLQRVKQTLSGPDSGLRNAWDEICIQRQSEESFFWDVYDETVRQRISARLKKLPGNLVVLLWFEADTTGAEDAIEYDEDELTAYIAGEFVYPLAETHSNQRIERFLWREI